MEWKTRLPKSVVDRPRAGDALVCGTSIASAGGMDRVRPLMGVCPQVKLFCGWLAAAGGLVWAGRQHRQSCHGDDTAAAANQHSMG